ncbi:SARP family transcriptional regulator [Rhizocola hellebori]|uniref:SARP family transcriptional regulator n=1 Tax=Rhizocola hellebori TaxID=1392758 RepID=A0A8J3VJ90_9ACTN|nr:SARP family transcriptional regulator [Rhizocola hellebori]
MAVRVVVLGRVGMAKGAYRPEIGRAQTRAILALLAINVGEPVSAAGLTRALWGGTEPSTARAQIHNAISALRRVCADIGAKDVIVSGRYGYQLLLPAEDVDLGQFRWSVRQAKELKAHDAVTAARVLREGLQLWHGEPLADAAAAFVDAARLRLAEERLVAIEELADLELSLDNPAAVTSELMSVVAAHPFREGARRRLMLALHRSGRHAEALQSYRTYRDLLADQEGLDPGAEISELEIEIIRGIRGRPLDGSATAAEISELPAVGGQKWVAPAQVPGGVGVFVGRQGYLDQLDIVAAATAHQAGRVILVSGTAGIGKTTLATVWAHRMADQFPDGQLFIDLHGFAPGSPMPATVALARFLRALGQPPDAIPTDLDGATAMFRSLLADRRVLIVLDNASEAEQVRPLLPGSGGCLVVVTSRDNLTGLSTSDGLSRVVLDVLTSKESNDLFVALLGRDRVDSQATAMLALSDACGQVPLAIRMVAANLADAPGRSAADYLADLTAGEKLDLMQLVGDGHASVRAAFDLSYRTLPARIRRLFRMLSVVPGGNFSAALAVAIAGTADEQVIPDLSMLVRKSLLYEVTPRRYAFYDLVRLYAKALSEKDSALIEAADRMYRHYLDELEGAAQLLYPQMLRLSELGDQAPPEPTFVDGPAALAWLDTELPNLTAATLHAAAEGPRPMAWLISDAMRGYFWSNRQLTEWLAIADAGLRAAARESDAAGMAANHIGLGSAYRCMGRYGDSVEQFESALIASRGIPWPQAEATALSHLAVSYAEVGHTLLARDRLTDALAVNRQLDRPASEAVVLGNLGSLRVRTGELGQSLRDFNGALTLYREIRSSGGEAIVMTNLGLVHFYLGRFGLASQHLTAGLTLHRQIGDRYGQALALCNLAYLRSEQGRHHDALEHASEAMTIVQATGDRQTEAYALITMGHIRLALNAPHHASQYYTQGMRLSQATGQRLPELEARIGVAQANLRQDEIDASLDLANQALRDATEFSYELLAGQTKTLLAEIHLAAARFDDARRWALDALAVHRKTEHRPGEARTHHLLGQIYRANGEPSAASLSTAQALFAEIGIPQPVNA